MASLACWTTCIHWSWAPAPQVPIPTATYVIQVSKILLALKVELIFLGRDQGVATSSYASLDHVAQM
eukprot:8663483-Prorocentrum_lima.AAC.1